MTKLHAVLLDLDGTLVDHEGAAAQALREWLPTLGVSVTGEVIALWAAVQEKHLVGWREGRISFAEQRRRRLRDFLPAVGVGFADDEQSLDEIFGGYLRWYEASWRAFEDVPDALAAIARAGVATAVLTNGTVQQQTAKLARVGLLDKVGPVFTPENIGAAKPSAAAFLEACARLGLPPATVLHVGDRYDLDVVAARAAGLPAVHLDRSGGGHRDGAIGSLAEIVRLVKSAEE